MRKELEDTRLFCHTADTQISEPILILFLIFQLLYFSHNDNLGNVTTCVNNINVLILP